MPVYTYKFASDDSRIEVKQSITDEAFEFLMHPETGELESVTRVPMPPSITLKGSGFYKTDKSK